MAEDFTKKSVYWRITRIATELDKANLKKTGYNKYNEFYYFELADFLPTLNMLSDKYGVCNRPVFLDDHAELHIVNVDNPEDVAIYAMPNRDCDIKGAQPIQKEGGRQTYTRKYLLMNAYSITDGDVIDGGQNEAYDEKMKAQSKPKQAKQNEPQKAEAKKEDKPAPKNEEPALSMKEVWVPFLEAFGFDQNKPMTEKDNVIATEHAKLELKENFGTDDIRKVDPSKYREVLDYAIKMSAPVGPENFKDEDLPF